MASFDEAFLSEVRDRNDILSVIGDYVALRKAGTSWKGLCPFHGEKTPSFHVHPDRKFFYCFGCQTGGDVISFVREINGYSFPEAVRTLAQRAGMPLPADEPRGGWSAGEPSRVGKASRAVRDGYYAVHRVAQSFFRATLDTAEGTGAREYLRGRGVSRETVTRFGLGLAPNRWDGLVGELERTRCDLEVAESLGLIVRRSSGAGYYDRFRDRLMFPIRNIAGEVLGYSGRRLSADPEQAKYVNSPDSPIYQKGSELYGLHEARQAMRRAGRALVVEGNVDLVKLAQAGFEEVVAPLGTALTAAQCRLIKRFVPRAVALYDGDGAGREAAKKAAALALAEGLVLEIATLPDGEDPDSVASRAGADGVRELVEGAVGAWEHLLSRAIAEHRGLEGTQGARLVVTELAPVLAAVESGAERELLERSLADALRLEVGLVRELGRGAQAVAVAPEVRRQEMPAAPLSAMDLRLLELLILIPEARALYVGRDVEAMVADPRTRGLAERVCEVEGDATQAMAVLPPGPAQAQLLARMAGSPAPVDGVVAFEGLVRALKRDGIERRLEGLRRDERQAWLNKDDEAALVLSVEKSKLERQLEALKANRD